MSQNPVTDPATPLDRTTVVEREREAFGGIKPFCAFFGWLTATGMSVLLTALVAAAGAGVSLVSDVTDVTDVTDAAADQGVSSNQIGWAGVVLLLIVVFLAYYSGGYVAGRMARFDGIRQGLAVWLWAVVAAVVVAVLGAVAGAKYDVLGKVDSFPRIPVDSGNLGDLGLTAVVALVGVVAVSLLGALAGGLAGMHFHRRVDRAGLGR